MIQYQQILQEVLDKGTWKRPARDNMPRTISRFSITKRFDLQEGFPLVTTKKMFLNGVIHELLWFLKGDTNIKYLIDNEVNIWNEDAFKYFQNRLWLLPGINNITIEEFILRIKAEVREDKFHYTYGDVGPMYGHQWRDFNGTTPFFHIGKKPSACSTRSTHNIGHNTKAKNVTTDVFYMLWSAMKDRCYNYNSPHFSKYGGKGVYVCDSWLDFGVFREEIKLLPNYTEKLKYPDKYQLDKDLSGGKYYSKETCIWMKSEENAKLRVRQFEYTISDGVTTHTFSNGGSKARELKIDNANLNSLCHGRLKTTGSWYLVNKKDLFKGEDQILSLLKGITNNPESRYNLITAWNPNQISLGCLPPCHMLFMLNCREIMFKKRVEIAKSRGIYYDMPPFTSKLTEDGIPTHYLDCDMTQRSCDTPLGVPFNIASYALLTMIIAKLTNTVPGEFIWSGKDVHIYENQLEGVKEQLTRMCLPLPTMKITGDWNSIDDIKFEDFNLVGYQHHPAIKYPLSTGLILR